MVKSNQPVDVDNERRILFERLKGILNFNEREKSFVGHYSETIKRGILELYDDVRKYYDDPPLTRRCDYKSVVKYIFRKNGYVISHARLYGGDNMHGFVGDKYFANKECY